MSVKSMRATELKNLLDKQEDLLLIDCREFFEWNNGHIEGAILMPLSNFEQEYKNIKDKSKKIIIQCRSGRRSFDACLFLEFHGYTDLTNLDGGILEWDDLNYPITIPHSSL